MNNYHNDQQFIDYIHTDTINRIDQLNNKSMDIFYKHYNKHQTDNQKIIKFSKDFEQLKFELSALDISKIEYDYIIQQFTLWKKTNNNKIVLEDIIGLTKKINIIISDRLLIDGIDFGSNITNKTTIQLINCDNININIGHKINHLCTINCSFILLKINENIISGIDTINSNNIIHVVDKKINFMDLSSSHKCKCVISNVIAPNTIIQTTESLDFLIIVTDNRIIKSQYDMCKSFVDTFNRFTFRVDQNNDIQLQS